MSSKTVEVKKTKIATLEELEFEDPIAVPNSLRRPVATRPMVLMGSGPTNSSKRVMEALCKPTMGLYTDEFQQVMDEVRDGLKYLFQTRNEVTFAGTGSGNVGMDIVLSNLIEPKDVVMVCVSGVSGHRAVEMAIRYGADVRILESRLGQALRYEQIRAHFDTHKPKILFVCHGDTSTGVLQKLDGLGELCHRNDCLLVVDAVATLGAVDLYVDEYKIDACFSTSQKVLGAPAGLCPVTFNKRAMAVIEKRKVPSAVYSFDAKYFSELYGCEDKPRFLLHTISAPVLYAFREAISEVIEEGLDLFKSRHAENGQRLREGLQNIGLELFVENPEHRLPSVTSVRIPHGVKMETVMKCMMERHSVEIVSGIGATKDVLFRIGVMNSNATSQKVDLVLRALYEALKVTANFIAPQTKVYY